MIDYKLMATEISESDYLQQSIYFLHFSGLLLSFRPRERQREVNRALPPQKQLLHRVVFRRLKRMSMLPRRGGILLLFGTTLM